MDPREEYYTMQEKKVERGEKDFRFPIAAELAYKWEREDIPIGDLMERDDLQLYVGNPGEFAYHIWDHTGTPQANEIGRNWDTIVKYLPSNDEIQKHVENINGDLAKLVIYSRQKGDEYPIIIVENKHLLPYTTGSIIDGNHRLIALLKELRDGNIQESTPIPVWRGKVPTCLVLPYSLATMATDNKSLAQKILLFKQRLNR